MPLLELGGVPGRNISIFFLAAAVTAIVVEELLERAATGGRRLAMLLSVSAFVFLDNLCIPYPYAALRKSTPVYDQLARDADDFAVLDLFPNEFQNEMQYLQTRHGKRLLTGFVSRIPAVNRTQWDDVPVVRALLAGEDLSSFTDGDICRTLRRYDVRYLIVHPRESPALVRDDLPVGESVYLGRWGHLLASPQRFPRVMEDATSVLLVPPCADASALADRGESQTARERIFSASSALPKPRNTPGIPGLRRLDLTKNLSLSTRSTSTTGC